MIFFSGAIVSIRMTSYTIILEYISCRATGLTGGFNTSILVNCCHVRADMFYTSRFTRFKISNGCWVGVDGVGED